MAAIQPIPAAQLLGLELSREAASDPYRAVIAEGKDMKSLKCDLCEHVAEGETFEEWMMALRPHYMEAHADVMSDSSRGKDEMEAWMKENRERFDTA